MIKIDPFLLNVATSVRARNSSFNCLVRPGIKSEVLRFVSTVQDLNYTQILQNTLLKWKMIFKIIEGKIYISYVKFKINLFIKIFKIILKNILATECTLDQCGVQTYASFHKFEQKERVIIIESSPAFSILRIICKVPG